MKKRKLRANVGKRNFGRMRGLPRIECVECRKEKWGSNAWILNCEPLEKVDCLKCLGSHVAADAGCERDVVHRMTEGYRVWGELKSVLSNRGLRIKAKKCNMKE